MPRRKTTRIDLHTHTRGSDGLGTPEEIAKYAYQAGLDGICLTDHHTTYNPENLEVARACREQGLLVFHGCEYSTSLGHLLVYGVNVEDLNLGYYPDTQWVIDVVNWAGGVAIPAHPYLGYKRAYFDAVQKLTGIVGWETHNGQCTFRSPYANKQAKQAAKRCGKRGTGGSDAHNPRHIGLTYTEFLEPIYNYAQFLDALRAGNFRPVTSHKRVQAELQRRRKQTSGEKHQEWLKREQARQRLLRNKWAQRSRASHWTNEMGIPAIVGREVLR